MAAPIYKSRILVNGAGASGPVTDRKQAFERLEEPQRRGDAAAAIITAEFVARGISVLEPRTITNRTTA